MTSGTYPLTMTASGASVETRSSSATLTVGPPEPASTTPSIGVTFLGVGGDDFIWTVQGDSWTWDGVTVTRRAGYAGDVELTVEGLPADVTAAFTSVMSLDAHTTMSSVTFTAARNAPPVMVDLTIRARGLGVPDATTVFRFVVFPPAGG